MELVLSMCLLSLMASTTGASNVGQGISATPAIFDGTVYFPSWDGCIYAVKASNGGLVWKKMLQQLTGLNSTRAVSNIDPNITVSRTTPVIAHDLLIFGMSGPAYVVAVKRSNGELVWLTQLDKQPKAIITMSGTYYNGHFYVGTSSSEVTVSIEQCCIFRGSFVKLNARTGKILWRTYILPDNFGQRGEYAGASIWGSSPSIDIRRNHVYIGTGNLYLHLKIKWNCLALDRDNGNLIWSTEAGPGGLAGGGTWGAATDEKRVYTNIANSGRKNFTLQPSSKVTTAGGWVAMDSKNGRILWSTADPSNGTASGPVTVANGVLIGGSTFRQGPIYAMNTKSGEILWSYETGATIYGGASVSNGCIYIGHGYKVTLGLFNPEYTAGNSLFAFCVA
ncbi:hypothetical protein CXB51_003847 [Gossypium anomalum]|uniref:Pyrrolo-quinoline quinone repeat domain-containing protein n=1 Tax=Gossypium anomalum TaxID=47600 RepID=A0A8J5ZHH6_9ROSI|nr:hypothetical protein CXB51_003847 [Gossypium anomalum]